MNIQEYNKVKSMSYREYCNYLKEKYGESKLDYFTPEFKKNKVGRTSEGLYCHHIYEDTAIMLSEPKAAIHNPFEYQLAKNLCYCDLLEHLFAHILIHEEHDRIVFGCGIDAFLIPELNDFYSGWKTKQAWRINCHNKIKDDKEVYLTLIKRLKEKNLITEDSYCLSLNEHYGLWHSYYNQKLYNELINL